MGRIAAVIVGDIIRIAGITGGSFAEEIAVAGVGERIVDDAIVIAALDEKDAGRIAPVRIRFRFAAHIPIGVVLQEVILEEL